MTAKPTSQFSLPLPSWLQTPSVRTAEYERRSKRRRTSELDSEGEVPDDGDTTDTSAAGSRHAINLDDDETDTATDGLRRSLRNNITLTPNEAHQYRIAGLSPDQPLPQGKFPHVPPKGKHGAKDSLGKFLAESTASVSDPVYVPQSAAYRVNDIHLKHLLMLTTVLHRCLMEGEYTRAARAFGLLIREKYKGIMIDVRYSVRWGIGAEVLLRKGTGADAPDRDEGKKSLPFTRKGFTQAKEYYEQMIVRHPFSKIAPPHAISAVHFYPAMFGLWIYVTQAESNTGRTNIMDHYENSSAGSDDEDASERREMFKKSCLVADVRAQELSEAHQIAKRMDSVLSSPPYSDSPHLLEMRGMVSLWIGDLLVSSLRPSDPSAMEIDYGFEGMRREAYKQRELEWAKSRELLTKAKERGKGVVSDFGDLHFGSDSMEDEDMGDEPDDEDDEMEDGV